MAASEIVTSEQGQGWWLRFEAKASRQDEARWHRRVRYWLNSFRGFATFDVRGVDPR